MGLSDRLWRWAASGAHVLVVEVPGQWRIRAAVERAALDRGWSLALSPAEADVLAVCGRPGAEVSAAVEAVWHQLPGPRVRVDVLDRGEAADRLDEAHALLLDRTRHCADAAERPHGPDLLEDHGEMDHGEMDHGEMDHGEMDHGEMDHGDMEMAPGGIPLAEGGDDRDGLEMDVLNLRLGPVLPHWPAGLVLACTLQGDVITSAEAQVLDEEVPRESGDRTARSLDNLTALLALAGWDDVAARARRVRDLVLAGEPAEVTDPLLRSLSRRVRRSRVLRWSLRGLRPLGEDQARELGLPADCAGDTHDRLVRMLARVAAEVPSGTDTVGHATPASALPHLVDGLDLATARLVVASLDVDGLRAERSDARAEVRHG